MLMIEKNKLFKGKSQSIASTIHLFECIFFMLSTVALECIKLLFSLEESVKKIIRKMNVAIFCRIYVYIMFVHTMTFHKNNVLRSLFYHFDHMSI